MESGLTPLLLAEMFLEDEEKPERMDDDVFLLISAGMACAQYRQPRHSIPNYVEQVVPVYQMDDFRRFFRMSRGTFEAVCRIIAGSPHLSTAPGGRTPIPLEKQLLCTLWYLGGQDTFHKIADRFNVTESSFSRIRRRVFSAFLEDMPKYIAWPNVEERRHITGIFESRKGFPGIVGAIDGTHIPISAPSDDPASFINRKNFHSLVLQGVCRDDLRFIDCSTGYPGSLHDARILRQSSLWDNGLRMCGHGHLLGDGAYPCRRWLMTPYRNNGHLTRQQTHYNYCLSNSRVCVERAFGLLKGRFQRLRMVSTKTVRSASDVILVACILHNVVLTAGDDIEDFLQDHQENAVPIQAVNIVENDAEGFLKRDQLSRNLR